MAFAVLGVFVTYLPINSVSTALTTIGDSVGASKSDLQWVTLAYVITMAAAVLSGGVIGDLFGRRRVFVIGLCFTAGGALLSGLSPLAVGVTLPILWAGQAVAGVGGGLLLATTLSLIANAVPIARDRGRSIAMWAAGTTAALAVGPVLAGVILEFAGWGWTFAPTVVLAAGLALVGRWRLPESSAREGRRLDLTGQVTAALAIVALIFAAVEGGAEGWGSPTAVSGAIIGGVALVIFIVHELRTPSPLVDVRLFRSAAFASAALASLLALFSIVGAMFLLSLYLGAVQGLTGLELASRIIFVPGVAALASPLVGRLLTRAPATVVLTLGLLLAALGLVLLSAIDSETSYADLIWRLAVFGISNAMMLASVSTVAVASAPRPQAGMAGATNTAVRQFGGALGPAVLGSIYVSQLTRGAAAETALSAAFVSAAIALAAAGALNAVVAARRQR